LLEISDNILNLYIYKLQQKREWGGYLWILIVWFDGFSLVIQACLTVIKGCSKPLDDCYLGGQSAGLPCAEQGTLSPRIFLFEDVEVAAVGVGVLGHFSH